MGKTITMMVNGRTLAVEEGATVAAALLTDGVSAFRASPTGDVRAPLCGMGICFECRVTIDGVAHRRACMTVARPGMNVTTAGAK
jgi:sarcosine oxidase subunit alpha